MTNKGNIQNKVVDSIVLSFVTPAWINAGSLLDMIICLSLKMRSVMGTKRDNWNPSKKLETNIVRTAMEKSLRWPFKKWRSLM